MNLTNPGTIELNEILELYKKYVDPKFAWKNFSQEEQSKILLSERSNNELDATLLRKVCPSIKPIRESIEDLMKSWNKSYLKP